MTREEIIQGLQFTIDMFLFDPNTGETFKEPRNDMDKTTIDACKGAIELLEQQPCEDAISREDALMCMTGEYIADMTYKPEDIISKHIQRLRALPSVQPKLIECEDTISRQAVLDKIKEVCFSTEKEWVDFRVSYGSNGQRDFIVNFIESLPSIQPKPKTGHWIYEKRKRLINETDEGAEYVTDYWCKCSKCGGDFGYRKMMDTFCKYCGARMIEPQESEDKE